MPLQRVPQPPLNHVTQRVVARVKHQTEHDVRPKAEKKRPPTRLQFIHVIGPGSHRGLHTRHHVFIKARLRGKVIVATVRRDDVSSRQVPLRRNTARRQPHVSEPGKAEVAY